MLIVANRMYDKAKDKGNYEEPVLMKKAFLMKFGFGRRVMEEIRYEA